MLKTEVVDALNDHVNAEMFSAYLYYSMATYFEEASLPGFAHWMRCQAMEEMLHAHKLVDYIGNRRGSVRFAAVAAPPQDFEGPLAVMAATYEHEKLVTARIGALIEVAMKASDFATAGVLQGFVTEQVEEEAQVELILQQMRMAAESKSALFMLDREMAARPTPAPMTAAQ